MAGEELCEGCHLPSEFCHCEYQAAEHALETGDTSWLEVLGFTDSTIEELMEEDGDLTPEDFLPEAERPARGRRLTRWNKNDL